MELRLPPRWQKNVNKLVEALQIEQANVSQQLAILRVRNVVVGRKSDSNVYYSVSDRTLFKLPLMLRRNMRARSVLLFETRGGFLILLGCLP